METRHRSRGQRPGSLPPEANSLIGRQREISDIKRLVGGTRLVTLTGPGGAGKTRLALRVGADLEGAYPDGVRLVDLGELADGSLLEYAIAEALAIGGQTDRPLARLLDDYLVDRELLLILDNCEHVLDACAATVDRLLRTASGLSVLCTSRQALGMVGEAVRVVTPLAVPAGTHLTTAEAAAYPALTLFADRAAAVLPGFALTPENVPAVASICRRLDGLPLAIELAVAQLRSRSLDELANGLCQSLSESPGPASPPHHAGLRDTFDWSYGLCSPAERALWARLAVFAGFDEAGAAAVCAGDDLPAGAILDTIVGLVDKSIVLRDESTGTVRYHLLETVREYGLYRLDEAERTALRRRHRDWYVAMAERFDAEWFGAGQDGWAARIRGEYANLRLALGWCLSTPGETAAGARLAHLLRYFWVAGGALVEGRYWLHRALMANPAPTPERARVLSAYNRILITQIDRTEGAVRTAESLELARRFGDPVLLAQATRDYAIYLLRCGDDISATRPALEEALARSAALGDADLESVTMTRLCLAMTLLYEGDGAGAAELCAQCRETCAAVGERWCRSHALVASALVAQARGELGLAMGYIRESLRLREALGDTVGMAIGLDVLAGAAVADGDVVRAATLRGASRRAWHDVGVPGGGSRHYEQQDERSTRRTREELGEEAFEAAFQDGWKLSLDEALGYALETEAEPAEPQPEPGPATPLTPREWQVAQLVAEGLSNRQIATRLGISQRTAESHVENIRAKLDFVSRTQIATWVARLRKG